ncbi:hypothetical protein CsatB_020744 [Cannabis sativa]|uniref:Ubiquitin-like domain-containing protein n=1 Tax=Cannabis sativa TaxID=3483 RepID=A0A7J6HGJ0_CANSA|nr:hypothetical protein G4B88_018576 [Cannabis sativa]
MKLVVEILTGTLFYIEVGSDDTVSDLKRQIAAQENLPYDRLILTLLSNDGNHNRPINDEYVEAAGSRVTLADHGIHDGSHIYLVVAPPDENPFSFH